MNPPPSPSVSSTATDLELLRAFEPVCKYTLGEQFYPMDVERYIRYCALCVRYADGRDEILVPRGALTLDVLVQPRALDFDAIEYLRFVAPQSFQESVGALSQGQQMHRAKQNVFKAGLGRLARGGLLPRVADAIFSLTLLLRGRVPGAVAAQAEIQYDELQQLEEKYVYHGRVVRQNGWVVLQYWFFLAYNSWRSGFHGVNDHESDWELMMVYLYDKDGQLYPEWAAYASHDFNGNDLRRRWDDTGLGGELDLVNGHPVVYAGAGSHASYFRPGEYQAEVSLALPKPIAGWWRAWNQFLLQNFGIGSGYAGSPFRIPFVDFARGDGLVIGPGQDKVWTPNLISDATPWVSEYHGLWGLYARDPISGENAPAGPMYNRDGTPRPSWFDPLGFSGLDQVPPPPQELPRIEARMQELSARLTEIRTQLGTQTQELEELGTQLRAMQGNPFLALAYDVLQLRVNQLGAAVSGLRREESQDAALLETLQRRAAKARAGIKDAPRAHITHLGKPVSLTRLRFNRLADAWAAVSISALLLGFVALWVFERQWMLAGAVVMLVSFILLDALLRGVYTTTINTMSVLLAIIGLAILVYWSWQEILIGSLIVMAIFLLVQKVRELRE